MNLLLLQEIRRSPVEVGDVYIKPYTKWDKLPTSTGEFTGFLNHQQLLAGVPEVQASSPRCPELIRLWAIWIFEDGRWKIQDLSDSEGMMCVGAMGNPRKTFILSGYNML